MHGHIRASRTARLVCIDETDCHKMDLPDKKGIEIIGGAYENDKRWTSQKK